MSDYEYETTKYYITHNFENKKYNYERNIEITIFDGWKVLDGVDYQKINIKNVAKMGYYDNIKNNEIALHYVIANERLISSLLHYNEASLVRELEKRNIGRPSTYASIMDSIITKKYVEKCNIVGEERDISDYVYQYKEDELTVEEKKTSLNNEKNKLQITILGKQVIEFINSYFPDLFNYQFTGEMEDKLDLISNGNLSKSTVLNEYVNNIENVIKETKETLKSSDIKQKNKNKNSFDCGEINGINLIIKHGPYGYYACYNSKNTTLKGINGINIKNIIEKQEITSNESSIIMNFINQTKSNKYILELNDNLSIREGKFGKYIFYKTSKMKKPTFHKLHYTKCDYLEAAIQNEKKEMILKYIHDTYDIE